MNRFRLTAASIFIVALGLAGCTTEGVTRNTSHLDVTATPSANAGATACPATSPELQVYGTPHAARYYRVRLIDLNDPSAKHGEGEVSVNPSGLIPAGAIDEGYTPLCNGMGGHSYQYQVHAVDNLGHVLGTGAYTVTL